MKALALTNAELKGGMDVHHDVIKPYRYVMKVNKLVTQRMLGEEGRSNLNNNVLRTISQLTIYDDRSTTRWVTQQVLFLNHYSKLTVNRVKTSLDKTLIGLVRQECVHPNVKFLLHYVRIYLVIRNLNFSCDPKPNHNHSQLLKIGLGYMRRTPSSYYVII